MARTVRRSPFLLLLVLPVGTSLLAWLVSGDWLGAPSVLLLWAAWLLLPSGQTPPVLPLAFTFQWLQVNLGVFYYGITKRLSETVEFSDYRPMVLIGLGCLGALLAGLVCGTHLSRLLRNQNAARSQASFSVTGRTLVAAYLLTTALTGIVRQAAWLVPGLTQGILAVSFLRIGVLFLLFRRLSRPVFQTKWIGMLLAAEILWGFTGFFAGFREPLMMAALAFTEIFDPRRARHWLMGVVLLFVMLLSGVLWMGIRTTYRKDFAFDGVTDPSPSRLSRVGSLSSDWFAQDLDDLLADVDLFVERVWAVYYPALALERVPSVLPHENGRILGAAMRHLVTPRLFFPEKPVLASDSEMVRKYSGVWVAGEEEGTSIAFGYAIESYVDFGLPWMFVPVLVFGLLMGMAYLSLLGVIRHRELAVALVTVIFWLALFSFERSWVKILGLSATLILYLGSAVFLLDRALVRHKALSSRTPTRRTLMNAAQR